MSHDRARWRAAEQRLARVGRHKMMNAETKRDEVSGGGGELRFGSLKRCVMSPLALGGVHAIKISEIFFSVCNFTALIL